MLSRKKQTINKEQSKTKDVVHITKLRRIGNLRIRLTSYDKGPWQISISNGEQAYSFLKMTKDEFRELMKEMKDLLGDL